MRKNNNTYTFKGKVCYLHIKRLGKEYISKIDTKYYNQVSRYAWKISSTGYVTRTYEPKYLHRFILSLDGNQINEVVDHINRDKLDNRRSNLRTCSYSQNNMNYISKTNKSGFRGVVKHYRKWNAQITFKRKNIYLGSFSTKEEAAEAYNNEAVKLYGDFAVLNKIPKTTSKKDNKCGRKLKKGEVAICTVCGTQVVRVFQLHNTTCKKCSKEKFNTYYRKYLIKKKAEFAI